jgi:hypothetical protein
MPFGPYRDFKDCVAKNSDKDDPEAYCSTIEREILGPSTSATPGATLTSMKLQIVPVVDEPVANVGELGHSVSVEVEVEMGKDREDKMNDEMMPMPGEDDLLEDDVLEDEIEDSPDDPEDFHTMMVLEGVWTGDGRYIEEGALSWRDLPLPLMATDRTTEGHMNAVLIGRLTRIERMGRELHAYGSYVETDDPTAISLQNLVRKGELRGVSVDLDSLEYEVIVPGETSAETVDPSTGEVAVPIDDLKMRVTSARIMGCTVVPFPAFQEAFIENIAALTASISLRPEVSGWIAQFSSYSDIDFSPPQGAREEAQRGLDWRSEFGRGGTEVGVARARDISNGRSLSPDTITRMVSYFARHEVDKQGQGWSPGEDGFPSAGRIAWALWGGDPGMAWANKVKRSMAARDEQGSIVASGHPIEAPVVPPSSWFANPKLTEPTALTVDDSGRVYGHLAVWGQCHVGFGDRCIQPPHSPAAYAHFLTGEILCDDGFRFPVGQITMNAGHAPQSANASQTAAHYDNTAMAAADVTAGEDDFGIWVAGALRPGLRPEDIRALMAADVSGDWRRIGGALELVAVLAVNVPGFPKIRVKESLGLVASLSLPAYEGDPKRKQELMARAADRIASSIGRSKTDRIAELTRRLKEGK